MEDETMGPVFFTLCCVYLHNISYRLYTVSEPMHHPSAAAQISSVLILSSPQIKPPRSGGRTMTGKGSAVTLGLSYRNHGTNLLTCIRLGKKPVVK